MTATIDHTEETPEVRRASATPADAPVRRVSYRGDALPWRGRDLLLCSLLAALGVGGVVVCWFGATDEAVWRDQTGWLTGAILSTGLVILGGGLCLLIGVRRVRQGFRDLRRDQRAALGLSRSRTTATSDGATEQPEAAATGDLVTAPEMTRAHRPECLLLRGKATVRVPVAEIGNYGRCGVCNS